VKGYTEEGEELSNLDASDELGQTLIEIKNPVGMTEQSDLWQGTPAGGHGAESSSVDQSCS